jgi:hypothetical protein
MPVRSVRISSTDLMFFQSICRRYGNEWTTFRYWSNTSSIVMPKKAGKKFRDVTSETLELLQAYDWPGNIRELQNVIEPSGYPLRWGNILG